MRAIAHEHSITTARDTPVMTSAQSISENIFAINVCVWASAANKEVGAHFARLTTQAAETSSAKVIAGRPPLRTCVPPTQGHVNQAIVVANLTVSQSRHLSWDSKRRRLWSTRSLLGT